MACIATPADLGTVKGGTSSSQSATLLMPPALLFGKVEHQNMTFHNAQSKLFLNSDQSQEDHVADLGSGGKPSRSSINPM